MLLTEGILALRERLGAVGKAADTYFAHANPVKADDPKTGEQTWAVATEEVEQEGEGLRSQIKRLGIDVAGAARGSPLIAEADLQELRRNIRQMLASVRYSRYRYQGVYVHHDEDVVLGVDPPHHYEQLVDDPIEAARLFNAATASIADVIDLLSPAETVTTPSGTANYRPNTAFIMMAIDKNQPQYEDIKNAMKDVFKEFGIAAGAADDIEHDDGITDRILHEIETSEFLIADLTGERPNVYYEIGHAHALNKRVMLYRRQGTKVHFDIAHRNCPEYENATALKVLLKKRLEVVTNRPTKL